MNNKRRGRNTKRAWRGHSTDCTPECGFMTLEGEMNDLLETMRDLTICHREWLKLSQKQIAHAAEVDEAVVQAYEAGDFGNLDISTVQRIWQAVGMKTFFMPPQRIISSIPFGLANFSLN